MKTMANFCSEMSWVLRDQNKERPQIKDFRPLFVYTWYLMLQNYINKREDDIDDIVK